ncbi:MAG: RNA 2',3'-cyclic phosphodiesterase, partial [Verrucomicrobiae bacterium]|nr:RNA 2',3'-cyclic phosphodiesterase [Verrucomicrobiae bacterium]
MSESLRVFVALPLGDSLRARLAELQHRLRGSLPERAVRWVRAEQVHLTLRFLGDVAADRIDSLKASLAAAVSGSAPLALEIGGLGVFPNPRRPRVIWVGLEGALEPLACLQQAVAQAGEAFAREDDRQTFQPHLTLGRVNDRVPANGRAVAEALPAWRFDEQLPWPA